MMPEETPKPVALVTGGTRGIGLGCAEALARAGFQLALNGMRPAGQVRNVLAALHDLGADVLYCPGNIADADARRDVLASVHAHFGRLHVLVNNAGIAPRERKDLLDATEASFDEVMGVNLKGPYFLTQAVARWMVEQRRADPELRACIINVSSISATVASIQRGEYCVSKAGLSMMTLLFATRLGGEGIPVYEVRPGITQTDMTAAVAAKYDNLIRDGLCVTPRWGLPEDVGKAVRSLACGDFAYSTGQVVMVDGGLTIPRL